MRVVILRRVFITAVTTSRGRGRYGRHPVRAGYVATVIDQVTHGKPITSTLEILKVCY